MGKDKLGIKLKKIMEEETGNIEFSQELKNRILKSREITLKEKIVNFLNKEVEIPLIPAIATFGMIVILIGIPKDIFRREDNFITINIGSSQIIVRNEVKAGGRDEN